MMRRDIKELKIEQESRNCRTIGFGQCAISVPVPSCLAFSRCRRADDDDDGDKTDTD